MSTPDFRPIFLCDIETVEEVYALLPHKVEHRDQKWVLGRIKQLGNTCWLVSVYELAEGGRKRRQGDIEFSATLAGMAVELDHQGRQSAIARTAFDRLVQELAYATGTDLADDLPLPEQKASPDELPLERHAHLSFPLRGAQVQHLCGVLESAFTEGELQRLVRVHFDENWHSIVGGNNYREKVLQFVQWTERTGQVDKLLGAAQQDNPTNADLAALAIALQP